MAKKHENPWIWQIWKKWKMKYMNLKNEENGIYDCTKINSNDKVRHKNQREISPIICKFSEISQNP